MLVENHQEKFNSQDEKMLNFKTIEPSTQTALLVNPNINPNLRKNDLDDSVDNAVSDFWKELEKLEKGKDHRSLSGPM